MLQDVAALATALGVLIAVWQLWESLRVAKAQFEDGLNAQYRALIAELPLDALLGRQLSESDLNSAMPVFYRYFDLSNEQANLYAIAESIHSWLWPSADHWPEFWTSEMRSINGQEARRRQAHFRAFRRAERDRPQLNKTANQSSSAVVNHKSNKDIDLHCEPCLSRRKSLISNALGLDAEGGCLRN